MKNARVNLTGAIGQMGGDLVVKESGCQGHVTTTKVNSHIIYLFITFQRQPTTTTTGFISPIPKHYS